jgi:hypothetical protein
MKRLIAAASLAVLANAAFAVEIGKPFEELVDVQRVLPNLPDNRTQFAASGGDTRSDREIATENGVPSTERSLESPWAHDHNFIAPAQ